MSIAEDILKGLEDISKSHKLRENAGYIAGSVLLDAGRFEEAIERIEGTIAPIVKNGEKISCELKEGEVIDCSVKSFSILKGRLFELYSYDSLTAGFIRIYMLQEGSKEWIAVYIDENAQTPWWSEKDRI